MLTATAVARISGATTFTIAEFTGPVDANNSSCASTMAVQYTAGVAAVTPTRASGAAISVAMPDTHRYDCFVTLSSRSLSQPPSAMPIKPVAITTAAKPTDACPSDTPPTHPRNVTM